ncbi:MAG: potassium-transporting ATPase subunit KdpC [Candidatus Eisenbacteria bacterium]|uniref:Potassium-transporting ATPase KdpC subunit n=1 Tax=Eiseniibacteriota bacterium TaxID=2212470 RepID=A0A933SD29_UNCEI|nr:potassium-transporting ATPase subunit KdpC [Candidatus Eisenbacteria bacterium]
MFSSLRPAFVLLVSFTLITGVAYPLAVTAVARVAFPQQAGGSLVRVAGRSAGSRLIGQEFAGERWFHGRPSATSPKPYDAMVSSGSNLGPTNPALLAAVHKRAEEERASSGNSTKAVPVDLVTASGSGLDPHVSPAAARWQVARVARARGLDSTVVRALVDRHTEPRQFGLLGVPRVNVLELNLALERMTGGR